jgi:2,5-furandicarboxylate decarboxylase 1
VLVIPGAHGSRLGPPSDDRLGAKMGIDATISLGTDEMRFKRIRLRGEGAVDATAIVDPRPATAWRGALR